MQEHALPLLLVRTCSGRSGDCRTGMHVLAHALGGGWCVARVGRVADGRPLALVSSYARHRRHAARPTHPGGARRRLEDELCPGLNFDLTFEPRYRVQGTVTGYSNVGRDSLLVINGKRMKIWRAQLELLAKVTDIESGAILSTETFRNRSKSTKARTGRVSEAVAFLAPYRTRMERSAPADDPA